MAQPSEHTSFENVKNDINYSERNLDENLKRGVQNRSSKVQELE